MTLHGNCSNFASRTSLETNFGRKLAPEAALSVRAVRIWIYVSRGEGKAGRSGRKKSKLDRKKKNDRRNRTRKPFGCQLVPSRKAGGAQEHLEFFEGARRRVITLIEGFQRAPRRSDAQEAFREIWRLPGARKNAWENERSQEEIEQRPSKEMTEMKKHESFLVGVLDPLAQSLNIASEISKTHDTRSYNC